MHLPHRTEAPSRRGLIRALGVGLALAVSACQAPRASHGQGPRLVLSERYGDPVSRSMRLEATLVAEGEGLVGLDDVLVRADPPIAGTKKLEAILDDARLEQTDPGAWPRQAHMLPAEAAPLLRRVQLALWLLDRPAGDGSRDHAELELFDETTSLGLTRVSEAGGEVTVRVLSLAVADGEDGTGMAVASGRTGADLLDLRGTRQVFGGPAEAVQLHVERHPAPAAAGL
ncbi:MAG: hypothetical protein H6744_04535 [Deltaproteobacteria bacterium]|nr:hypothetical protein [Deltaproteobacteria bacterium]MCB9785942.1 hypothetical protein [Deltaproteobacteria bacterium]